MQNSKNNPRDAWLEFDSIQMGPHGIEIGYCGLCGNSGVLDTTNSAKTPGGRSCGVKAYCICPNGRSIKKHATGLPKWGGTSIKE